MDLEAEVEVGRGGNRGLGFGETGMQDWLMDNGGGKEGVSVSDSNLLGGTLKIDDGSGEDVKSWIIDNGDQDFATNHTNLKDEV